MIFFLVDEEAMQVSIVSSRFLQNDASRSSIDLPVFLPRINLLYFFLHYFLSLIDFCFSFRTLSFFLFLLLSLHF